MLETLGDPDAPLVVAAVRTTFQRTDGDADAPEET